MSGFEIRPMQPDELERVVGVWRRSREAAQPWLEERMKHSHADDLRHFGQVVARQNRVWIAAENDEPVGLLALAGEHVDQLYVEPAAQGRGIGTALLEKARELSPHGLTLFTHQRNARARIFYERRGFRAIAFGSSPPPENEPDVKYSWDPDGSALLDEN
jgi:ribosomal protein S18 acetylase RimI-like enzyme